jgi:outer membrane protein assembly factor BamB
VKTRFLIFLSGIILLITSGCGRGSSPRKISHLKNLHLTTGLSEGGRPRAALVVPDEKIYLALAEKINARLGEIGGAALPVVTKGLPGELLPKGNVIALGNMANNPFIEKLYFQWFAFTDRWYPGNGGYEIRSIHDPYGTGANVILLGASDDPGAARAVERFCGLLSAADPLAIGWVLEVELGPAVRSSLERSPVPPLARLFVEGLETPLGYTDASRLGLMYYYTGDPRHARAFVDAVRRSDPLARADHYHAHHNCLVWDLIEESPLFSDDDRLLVTNQLLVHARGKESGGGLEALSTPSDGLFDRHAAFIGICALCEGRYFARDYPGPEWPRMLASVDALFRPHLKSFASGSDLARGIYTYLEAILVFSLLTGSEEMVTSGALRVWADRCVAMCDPLGFFVPSGQYDEKSYPYFTLRKAAYLLSDPGLLYVAEMRRRAAETEGVHELGMEFDQGQAFAGRLEPQVPSHLTGVHVVGLDPREREAFDPRVPQAKSFSKITFRSGFEESDQFLVLDGIWGGPLGKPIQDANAILQLTDGGRTFVVDLDPETKNRRSSYVNHNVLSVTANGSAPLPPRLARLEAAADLPSFGYTHTRVEPYVEGAWDRHLLWRKAGYFVVIDVFRSGRAAVYSLESQWRLLGRSRVQGGKIISSVGGDGFAETIQDEIVIDPVGWGDGEFVRSDWPCRQSLWDFSDEGVARQYARYAGPVINRLRPTAVAALEAGSQIGVASLLYTTSRARPHRYSIGGLGAGGLIISGDEPAWLAVTGASGTFGRGPLSVRSRALWATSEIIAGFGLTSIELDGRRLISASRPVDAEWDLVRGVCVLKLTEPATVRVDSREELRLESGERRLSGLNPANEESRNRLRNALNRDGEGIAPVPKTAAGPLGPAIEAPAVAPAPDLIPGAEVLDLAIEGSGGQVVLLAGCRDGRVVCLDGRGRARWEFRTGGPVHVVKFAELVRGRRAALAGSDDESVYALDLATGADLWSHHAQVFAETQNYPWWTLEGKAKVRSVAAADFNGDGRAEVAVGTGGMLVEMLADDGSLLWRQPVMYGLPARLLALSVHPEARPRLLAGLDFLASQSGVFRFGADGTLVSSDAYPSGRQGWDYTGISALSSAEAGEGKTVLAVGRSGAHNEVVFYDAGSAQKLGLLPVGDAISGLVWGKTGETPLAIVATEAGWVIACRPDGATSWSVPLPDAVTKLWAVGQDHVAACCQNGEFYILDATGRIVARGTGSWPAALRSTSLRD